MSARKIAIVDIDGTLIPILVNFDELRDRVREVLGVREELRPLGEKLEELQVPQELKKRAWELIELEELRSIERIDVSQVRENVSALRELRANGFRIVIATHRSLATSLPLLEKLGIRDLVDEIVTRDLSVNRAAQLKYLREKYEGSCMVFIGDTRYDAEASAEAGVPFIWVGSFSEFPRKIAEALLLCK